MKRFSQFVAVLMVVCQTGTSVMGQSAITAARPELRAAVGINGVGDDARVTLRLKDGSELRGYVSTIDEIEFGIVDRRTRQETVVTYTQVVAIKTTKGSWDYGARARKEVSKAGIGKGARIDLKLPDGERIKGNVVQALEDVFVVANPKTGATTTVAYSDVTTIYRPKSLGFNIGIGAAVVLGIWMAVYAGIGLSGGFGG